MKYLYFSTMLGLLVFGRLRAFQIWRAFQRRRRASALLRRVLAEGRN